MNISMVLMIITNQFKIWKKKVCSVKLKIGYPDDKYIERKKKFVRLFIFKMDKI